MKEITAYQSDDGKFVGTKEQVLEYEEKITLHRLVGSFINDQDQDDECWFGPAARWYDYSVFIGYIKQQPDFREFVKLIYGFKEGEE